MYLYTLKFGPARSNPGFVAIDTLVILSLEIAQRVRKISALETFLFE